VAAAAGATPTTTATLLGGSEAAHLQADALKGDLFPDFLQQADDRLRRGLAAGKLDADGHALELGKLLDHFAIEHKAEVGVQLFLQLLELDVAAAPRAMLEHDEDDFAGVPVAAQGVEHAGIFHAVFGGLGMGVIVVVVVILAARMVAHFRKQMDDPRASVKDSCP